MLLVIVTSSEKKNLLLFVCDWLQLWMMMNEEAQENLKRSKRERFQRYFILIAIFYAQQWSSARPTDEGKREGATESDSLIQSFPLQR